jgi:hypothetical protein
MKLSRDFGVGGFFVSLRTFGSQYTLPLYGVVECCSALLLASVHMRNRFPMSTVPGEISIVYVVVMEAITSVLGVVAMEVVVVVKIIVAEKVKGSNSGLDNNFTL